MFYIIMFYIFAFLTVSDKNVEKPTTFLNYKILFIFLEQRFTFYFLFQS